MIARRLIVALLAAAALAGCAQQEPAVPSNLVGAVPVGSSSAASSASPSASPADQPSPAAVVAVPSRPVPGVTTKAPAPVKTTTKPPAVKTTAPGHPVGNVHPGAFCAPEGATGYTSAGTLMRCTLKAGEQQPRWRAG